MARPVRAWPAPIRPAASMIWVTRAPRAGGSVLGRTGARTTQRAEISRTPPWHRACTHMGTMKRVAVLLSLTAVALLAVACAPASSSNPPLPICDEGEDGCTRVPRGDKQTPTKGKAPSGDPATPSPDDDDGVVSEADASAGEPDASADAGLGSLCTALAQCCKDIEAQGYLPDNCNSVVALRHESACYAQHQQYENAGDC